MKKITTVLILSILGLSSCKSDKEKQDEILSKFLFDSSIASIKTSLFYVNTDSINSIFEDIKDPELRLKFATELNDYSIKLQSKNDELSKNLEAIDKINMKEKEAKKEQANKKWENSIAGKIQKKHPEWSKEDCINITNKKIWIGMTYEMLVYERGKPSSINPSNYGNGINYQYCWDNYKPSCFYSEEDQIITGYN